MNRTHTETFDKSSSKLAIVPTNESKSRNNGQIAGHLCQATLANQQGMMQPQVFALIITF